MIVYCHHFTGGESDGNATGQCVYTAYDSDDQCSISNATEKIPLFTAEEETKFAGRYEE